MFNTIMRRCQDYYTQIPADTLPKVVKSGVYTFALALLFSGSTSAAPINMARPLFVSGFAALSSLVYGLTSPFFNEVFGDNQLILPREVVKQWVSLAIVSFAVNYSTTGKVNLLAFALFKALSFNLLIAAWELMAIVCERVINEPALAQGFRAFFKSVGFDPVPGSSSIFVNLELLP